MQERFSSSSPQTGAYPAPLRNTARALAAQIAGTDKTTMTRLRGLIQTSEDSRPSAGLFAEVALLDDHMAGVTQGQLGKNRASVTTRGHAIVAEGKQG